MSLYNDERPRKFSEVLGQDLIVRQIKRKIVEKRFPQTVIMTGPRGTGKTTCARIIAKAVNCEDLKQDGEPCCRCDICRAIEENISPAVLEMDAATHNGVEDVRSLIEQSRYIPIGQKKVFILDEVHMFSNSAWNALLKTLEEPPKEVVFILATTELEKIPATVLSRCLRFEFKKITRQVMEAYVYDLCVKYQIGIEPGALSLIVSHAEGCMRDALSFLDQFIGCEELEEETVLDFLGIAPDALVFDILDAIAEGDAATAIGFVLESERRGKNVLAIVRSVIEVLVQATGVIAGGCLPKERGGEYCKRLKVFCSHVTSAKLNQLTGTFLQVYPLLQKNVQLTFLVHAAITNVVASESLLCRLESEIMLMKEKETDKSSINYEVVCDDLEAGNPSQVVAIPAGEQPVQITEEDVQQFGDVPGFSEYEADQGDNNRLSTDGSISDLTQDSEQQPVEDLLSAEDQVCSDTREQRLVEGDAVSFDEIISQFEKQSLTESPKTASDKEKVPVQTEENQNFTFDSFDFFLAGGSARL